MARQPYGEVLRRLASEAPAAPAVIDDAGPCSRQELAQVSDRLAWSWQALGVRPGDTVSLCLPNDRLWFAACMAVWKLGAVPNPLSPRLPRREAERVLRRARPALVVHADPRGAPPGFRAAAPVPAADAPERPFPARMPPRERILASGGSTGEPKLIASRYPPGYDPAHPHPHFTARRAMLVPGPLHHAAPFSASWQAVLGGAAAIVMRKFDPEHCLRLIHTHRPDRMVVVPTMMSRIWKLPAALRQRHDVSSLAFVLTGGAPCPPWLMRAWIEWLGADVMHEAYGPSERLGGTWISGREWLEHPGSVGRPVGGRIRILDAAGRDVPPRTPGEIHFLPEGGPGSTYEYIGATARRTPDGWESVGDIGWMDEDGYLYLLGRRADMILVGGRNLYPAEVEAAIERFPAVRSCAVIGLPDPDLGERPHAIVEAAADCEGELREHLRQELAAWKIPRTIEFVGKPLRDAAGKLRRWELRRERLARLGAQEA